jgi:hypothetical protein
LYYAITIAALVVAGAALYGWGRKIRQLTGLSGGGWPLTTGFGLGTIIFLGGLCNLFAIARPWAFNAIILLGLGFSALEFRKNKLPSFNWRHLTGGTYWYRLLLLVIVVAVGGFVISTQLVPVTFNHHDDFEKYIPQVVRMLATGTVHDNPIGSIGIETLGGQAVLQGFVAADFPIEYINGADALFCLLLSLLIIGSVAFEHPRLGPAMLSGVLALLAVDPHYVNISGVYSIVALSLVLVFATSEEKSDTDRAHIEAIVGLLYAAQIAVKLTAVSFVGLHFVWWIGGTAWIYRDWRFALRRGLKAAFWTAAFLLPWIALWAPDYIAIMTPPPGSPVLAKVPQHPPIFVNPFSTNPDMPVAWYSAAAAIILCYGCAVFFHARQPALGKSARANAAAFAAFCIAATGNFVFCIAYLGPYVLLDAEAATRYSAPWLAAGIGATLALGPTFLHRAGERAPSRTAVLTSVCVGFAVILMFGHSLQQRISYAALYGMPQAYIRWWQPEARQVAASAMADALHGRLREEVHNAQSRVPAGSPILVWMVAPFLLDYERNPIHEIGWYQLVRPWTLIPKTDYVLWQYNGFGVRQPPYYAEQIRAGNEIVAQASVGALQFGDRLQQIWRKSEVLYDNSGIVVLRITCPNGIAQC